MTNFTASQRAELCVLPLEVALYRACKDLRGSAGAICELYGLNQNTFNLKLNPDRNTHHLNPEDIESVIAHTRDPRILDSIAAAFSNEETTVHWFLVPTVPVNIEGDMFDNYCAGVEKFGDLGKTLFASLRNDGVIDNDELSMLKKQGSRVIATVQQILAKAETLNGDV